MPQWEEQVGQPTLDMASSEMGYGFPEFHGNRDFARAIEELRSEVSMFAHGSKGPGAYEKLVDKMREVAQFAAEVDEAIDDWHEGIGEPRVRTTPNSFLSEGLEWLLPV
ncbi:hypothetical protein NW759_000388 [Fusarium solani]|nr:hypothetical protein NW759_000388 [Fusarium solani]